jgi:RimJ/RimL family protein N-acetyltransferase
MAFQTKAPMTDSKKQSSRSGTESCSFEGLSQITIHHRADKALSVTIESSRLVMQSVERSDVREYHEYLFSDRAVMRGFSTGEVRDRSYVEARLDIWCTRWESGDPFSAFAIRSKAGEFIGHLALCHGYLPGHSELAYALRPKMWGQGFGGEAVQAVVRGLAPLLRAYGFSINGSRFGVLNATTRSENLASAKVLMGVGMRELAVEEDVFMPRKYF